MKLKYDLHIHTALSPCGADDMTPNNVVNMSLLNELDILAITDHNTCGNLQAVMNVAKDTGLLVVPGIEIETKEEIHVVCLFMDTESVYNVQKIVFEHLPNRENKASIFGDQLLYNEADEIIGKEHRLLSFATDLSIDEVLVIAEENKGVMIPAHIDRPSYSIISNLGMIPENLTLSTLEISRHNNIEDYKDKYSDYRVIQNSDAHDLGFIGICNHYMDLEEKSVVEVIKYLKS